MRDLISEYNKRKDEIKKRLREFKTFLKKKDADIFKELCFCILTPQAKAVLCDDAVNELASRGLLLGGSENAVRRILRGRVRFHNKKAAYLVAARRLFSRRDKGKDIIDIRRRLKQDDIFKMRDWLIDNIKGFGYKEASHFLRNIGLGDGLAILDTHVLKNLKRYKVIGEIPSSLTKRIYLDVENRMREFSKKIRIPMEELDLLLWSEETGLIFK